ncbi:uncharacterized protein MCYG_06742 [Microsporum canis CBS 113480]|uniref:Uncharacterized protein n=1 Tax=Arthroderma otae (strain ATCC MYA-4605 / CBS 113480) TaxID=554155 RepID=C5FVI9_ARTOC|nr:uncharacterized protein MCYG_06742 [Microsporum canis CBS 113480]EEQ33923.1 predicted protein [Microsporum canis CBS 113480]
MQNKRTGHQRTPLISRATTSIGEAPIGASYHLRSGLSSIQSTRGQTSLPVEEEVKIFPLPEELLVNMNHILSQRQQSAMVSSPDAPLKQPPSRGLARPRRVLAVVVVVFSEYNMLDQLYQI